MSLPNVFNICWFANYLNGVLCGIADLWFAVLNTIVFLMVCCIVAAFDLFLVFLRILGALVVLTAYDKSMHEVYACY